MSTVPSRGRTVDLLPLFFGPVHVENSIELSEHQTEHPCWDSQRWTEHDSHILHRHLVHVRVLDDEDQVSDERSKERIVGQRELRYQGGQLFYSLLRIHEVWGQSMSCAISFENSHPPITDENFGWSSRVRMLAVSSRRNILSNPAIAWGSQYSPEASKSTSPSVDWFTPRLSFSDSKHGRG